VLSLSAPVAVNCCVLPICAEGLVGLTEIDTRVAGGAVPEPEPVFPPHAERINPKEAKQK
jgi:hypothetical protein